MAANRQTFSERIKEIEEHVGAWNTLWSFLGTAGMNTVAVYAAPSNIMRAFMGVAALLGSILSFGVTSLRWYGAAKGKRAKLAVLDFVIVAFCVVCGGFVLWIIDPDTARNYPWAERMREFLIAPSLVVDLIMALLSFVASYFLIAAICIISPSMNRKTGASTQDK